MNCPYWNIRNSIEAAIDYARIEHTQSELAYPDNSGSSDDDEYANDMASAVICRAALDAIMRHLRDAWILADALRIQAGEPDSVPLGEPQKQYA